MRALVIYSREGRIAELAQGIAKGLEAVGFRTDLNEAEEKGSRVIPVAQYDLICVGSPVIGFFGGQIGGDVDATLRRCTRMEGKAAVAFVRSKMIGATKSLRKLMAALERQGAMVQDFASLSGVDEAEEFGRKLDGVVKNTP